MEKCRSSTGQVSGRQVGRLLVLGDFSHRWVTSLSGQTQRRLVPLSMLVVTKRGASTG